MSLVPFQGSVAGVERVAQGEFAQAA
jgi:hypothetical protein